MVLEDEDSFGVVRSNEICRKHGRNKAFQKAEANANVKDRAREIAMISNHRRFVKKTNNTLHRNQPKQIQGLNRGQNNFPSNRQSENNQSVSQRFRTTGPANYMNRRPDDDNHKNQFYNKMECYFCYNMGHYKSNCPELKENLGCEKPIFKRDLRYRAHVIVNS